MTAWWDDSAERQRWIRALETGLAKGRADGMPYLRMDLDADYAGVAPYHNADHGRDVRLFRGDGPEAYRPLPILYPNRVVVDGAVLLAWFKAREASAPREK